MARFIKGINGAYSGKVGNVIGSSWRSIDYIRSLSKKSNKAASIKQLEQRARFGLAGSFIAPIKDIVNIGFSDIYLKKYTGYNLAVKVILDSAILGDYPNYSIDYSQLQVSKGAQAGLAQLTFMETAPQKLTITWENVLNRFNSFVDDDVIILLYDKEDKVFTVYENITRDAVTYDVILPPSFAGHTVTGWAFVVRRDGLKTSNSQYLGEVLVT